MEPIDIRQALDKIAPTDREIAERIGVSLRSIYRWKNGSMMPRGHALMKIQELARKSDAQPAEKAA